MDILMLVLLGILITHYAFGVLGGRTTVGGLSELIVAVVITTLGIVCTFAFVYVGYRTAIGGSWFVLGVSCAFANLICGVSEALLRHRDLGNFWLVPLAILEWGTRVGVMVYLIYLFGFLVNWWI